MNQHKLILPTIVISQFCCTTLWFASNGVMPNLIANFNLTEAALGTITISVQFGFIIGTLLFAILNIADRFSPAKVFLICAIIGAIFNAGLIWDDNTLESILIFRFLTGFFLAGIYPVGMKIAADHFEKGLGKSLGFLVGALVIGTAFPHLLKDLTEAFNWSSVVLLTSFFALLGGILMFVYVPNGPYRKHSQKLDLSVFFSVFKNHDFRSASFGYFGHMWELYTFWAFVPLILKTYTIEHSQVEFNIPLMSFFIIGIGGLGCILGGYLSEIFGIKRTATIALLLSFGCCLFSPFIFSTSSPAFFISFLLFWGIVVIADSPLFSTLVAQNTAPEIKGTALTIVNCIGFSITIISIQLLNGISDWTDSNYIYTLLALGPLLGLIALRDRNKL